MLYNMKPESDLKKMSSLTNQYIKYTPNGVPSIHVDDDELMKYLRIYDRKTMQHSKHDILSFINSRRMSSTTDVATKRKDVYVFGMHNNTFKMVNLFK